jgi:hypothetical protein
VIIQDRGLASEAEFDRPELSAGAGDVESHVHEIVQLLIGFASALWSVGPEFESRIEDFHGVVGGKSYGVHATSGVIQSGMANSRSYLPASTDIS